MTIKYFEEFSGFGLVWFGLVWFGMVWFGLVWFGLVWYGLVCFILDEGLETFLGIRDLEIYILLIYMVTRLQNYRTYRLLALFFFLMRMTNFCCNGIVISGQI